MGKHDENILRRAKAIYDASNVVLPVLLAFVCGLHISFLFPSVTGACKETAGMLWTASCHVSATGHVGVVEENVGRNLNGKGGL